MRLLETAIVNNEFNNIDRCINQLYEDIDKCSEGEKLKLYQVINEQCHALLAVVNQGDDSVRKSIFYLTAHTAQWLLMHKLAVAGLDDIEQKNVARYIGQLLEIGRYPDFTNIILTALKNLCIGGTTLLDESIQQLEELLSNNTEETFNQIMELYHAYHEAIAQGIDTKRYHSIDGLIFLIYDSVNSSDLVKLGLLKEYADLFYNEFAKSDGDIHDKPLNSQHKIYLQKRSISTTLYQAG